jgi:uridylate kinase
MRDPYERPLVLKLTGAIFDEPKISLLKDYLKLFEYLLTKGYRVAVVVGGGKLARQHIALGRSFGLDECFLDELGILATQLHAKLLLGLMLRKDLPVYPRIPRSMEELRTAYYGSKDYQFFVLGGLNPGHSTDAVAALAAETIGSRLLIVATKVDGVYSEEGKIVSEMNISELEKLLASKESKAGSYELFDKLALEIVKRSKIKLWFVNAFKPWKIVALIHGEDVGTLVKV